MNDDIKPKRTDDGQSRPVSNPAASKTVYGQSTTNVQSASASSPLPPTDVPASNDRTQFTPASASPLPQPAYQSVDPPKNRKGRFGFNLPAPVRGVLSTVELLAGALLLAFAINAFVFQSYEVVGQSMSPTLSNGDRLVISKVGKSWANTFGSTYIPARGSIVVFDSPSNGSKQLIKRVIGLPGERVIVENGVITVINNEHPEGFNPDESYKDTLPKDTTSGVVVDVPDGHIFVSGDNREGNNSLDSRNMLGTVPLENLVGSLVVRILPLSEADFF